MTACTTCPRTLRPDEETAGLHACRACIARTNAYLRELHLQVPLLRACLEPDTQPHTGRVGSTGRAHSPMPVRGDALVLLAHGTYDPRQHTTTPDQDAPIEAVLVGWTRHIAQYAGWHIARHPADGHLIVNGWCEDAHPSHGHSIDGWLHWLTAYLPYTAAYDWYQHLHRDVTDLIHRIRAITQTQPWERDLDAPCPRCDGFALYESWGQDIACDDCGRTMTRREYDAHAARVLPGLVRTALLMTAARTAPAQESA